MNLTNSQGKPKYLTVSKPDEIEAIKRNGLKDPIGGEYGGIWYAYDWSMKRWRASNDSKGGLVK